MSAEILVVDQNSYRSALADGVICVPKMIPWTC